MTRNELYISALLHDIGKFSERTKQESVEDKYKVIDKGHPKYSAQLFDVLRKKSSYFQQFSEDVTEAILYHHNPRNDHEKIIQLSDWLSSTEREKDETSTERYYKTPLRSIFSLLFKEEEQGDKYSYELTSLDLNAIFPEKDIEINQNSYQTMVKDFYDEIGKIKNEEQLYYLLQKYLWAVPAQTYKYTPDISLFDHSKTTAAIALCLYDQYEAGELTSSELTSVINAIRKKEEHKNKKEQFILINGDISGIQDFIFNIPSKGAAKSLKGRSTYLGLLSDVIAQYILDELELKTANLLYNGGGNFYILAPLCKKDKLKEIRKKILKNLLNTHDGDIYLALDYLPIAPKDFRDFSELWIEVRRRIGELKRKRWQEIGLQENFDNIFGPFDDGTSEKEHCHICGISKDRIPITYHKDDDHYVCRLCDSFISLTEKIKNANYFSLKPVQHQVKEANYNAIFSQFGYEIDFSPTKPSGENLRVYKLNDTMFIDDECNGYKFGAYKLPTKDHKQVTFEQLAEDSKGDQKLGILKLDVDNLGAIFGLGLGNKAVFKKEEYENLLIKFPKAKQILEQFLIVSKDKFFININHISSKQTKELGDNCYGEIKKYIKSNRSISRITTLSRMLKLFFEGYINQLITEKAWHDKLYVIFSGGDDTFIVGSWDSLFEFTKVFHNKFNEYTCYNPKVHFSAGLTVFRYNYPIIRAANITEEALESAKHYMEKDEKLPSKNKITFLSEIFNWQEFDRIESLKSLLVKLVEKGYGHALLHKVNKSTLGFRKILKDSNKGILESLRFWRLAYYLREVKKNDPKDAEKIIDEYRKIVLHNLQNKSTEEKINNIMIIPTAVRWAELETRNVKEDK